VNTDPAPFALEYPTMLAGRKVDREARARDFHQRALAVVDKANHLVGQLLGRVVNLAQALDVNKPAQELHIAIRKIDTNRLFALSTTASAR